MIHFNFFFFKTLVFPQLKLLAKALLLNAKYIKGVKAEQTLVFLY